MAAGPDGAAFRMYVRTQPHQSVPYPSLGPRPVSGLARFLMPMSLYPPTPDSPSLSSPDGELTPMEAQCLWLVLDMANRLHRPVEVIDVSHVAVPPETFDDGEGDMLLFPVLIRPDGAHLSGEHDFTPGRVRNFLKGRPIPFRG